jgi:hypothetical protein
MTHQAAFFMDQHAAAFRADTHARLLLNEIPAGDLFENLCDGIVTGMHHFPVFPGRGGAPDANQLFDNRFRLHP